MKTTGLAVALSLLLAGAAQAAPASNATADNALAIAKRAIAFRSVQGPGNQTPELARYLKQLFVEAGFADADVTVEPVDDTAYLLLRWRGTDPKARALVISGHMDVVEAKPADWQRDPFTPIVENGYLFGRGATDMKLDLALVTATVIDLKRAGYKPKRDLILAFSGDEETTMKTSAILASKVKGAEMVLNVDGGGGQLGEDGKPRFFSVIARRRAR